jgi:hypothetical protein
MSNLSDWIDRLCREYLAWNKEQGLDLGSADEHLFDETLTDDQRAWLHRFCERWDAAADEERVMAEVEREAMTNTDRETIMWRIADATGAQEREFQRAMGADWETSYLADWATTATTYKMLLADHRPAVHLPCRYVRRPR